MNQRPCIVSAIVVSSFVLAAASVFAQGPPGGGKLAGNGGHEGRG